MNDHGLSPDGPRPINRKCAAYQTDVGQNFRCNSIGCGRVSRPYFLTESSTESYLVIVGGRGRKNGVWIVPNDLGCSTRSAQPPCRQAHLKQAALRSGLWERHRRLGSFRVVAGQQKILLVTVRLAAMTTRQCDLLTSLMLASAGLHAELSPRVVPGWLRPTEGNAP